MLRDSVYFTTLKSLDYNVVMTLRLNNNNNNNVPRNHYHFSYQQQMHLKNYVNFIAKNIRAEFLERLRKLHQTTRGIVNCDLNRKIMRE